MTTYQAASSAAVPPLLAAAVAEDHLRGHERDPLTDVCRCGWPGPGPCWSRYVFEEILRESRELNT